MHPRLIKIGKAVLAIILAATGIAALPEAILYLTAFTQIGDIPENDRAEILFRSAMYAIGVAAYIWVALWLLRPQRKSVSNGKQNI